MSVTTYEAPETFTRAAAVLRAAGADGQRVRIVGGATKRRWGRAHAPYEVELHTGALDSILAHNAGDMTATLQAGVPLAAAQEAFAQAGQMLSLDPPLVGAGEGRARAGDGAGTPGGAIDGARSATTDGARGATTDGARGATTDGARGATTDGARGATIGGIVATADSGPLAHRYGGPRDLIVGATVALADGTVAKSGGTVIKNVAGYDIAKLMAGSFGTLGLLLSINVRLHPRPDRSATVVGSTDDMRKLQTAAQALAAAPAELEALDVGWHDGRGRLLAQVAGPRSQPRGVRLANQLRAAGLSEVELLIDGGAELWDAQRAAQRSSTAAIVRVAARANELAVVLAAVERCGGSLVGRAALGHSWVTLPPASIERLRSELPTGVTAIVQDLPGDATYEDPWGPMQPALLDLTRRLKRRFDPTQTCNPGIFVGGI
jgi:glycolate oxidase FAD binding subunit